MRVYGVSDIGLVRKENQDAFVVGENGDFVYAVVCDGMGGVNGGAVASETAVDIVSKRIAIAEKSSDYKFVLQSAVSAANISVYDKSKTSDELEGMGTTIVAVVVKNDVLHIAHAGDSRAYVFDGDNIKQLTRDHSVVQELLESGDLTPDQAQHYPNRNLITRALGVSQNLETEYNEFYLSGDYAVFICTDGVTNLVDDAEIADFIKSKPETAVDNIIKLAMERGGTDNATAVIISKNSMED